MDSVWKTTSERLAEAADKAGEAGHPEVVDMLSDTFDQFDKWNKEGNRVDECLEFATRMKFRQYKDDEPIVRNHIMMLTEWRAGNPLEHYIILNYDFPMFLWAKRRGFDDRISNNAIDVPSNKLTLAEMQKFDRQYKQV